MTIDPVEGILSYEGLHQSLVENMTSASLLNPDKLFVKWTFSIQVSPGSDAGR